MWSWVDLRTIVQLSSAILHICVTALLHLYDHAARVDLCGVTSTSTSALAMGLQAAVYSCQWEIAVSSNTLPFPDLTGSIVRCTAEEPRAWS